MTFKINSDYTDKEREILAERSLNFVCDQCGRTADLLLPEEESESEVKSEIDKYAKEVAISKPAANNNGNYFIRVFETVQIQTKNCFKFGVLSGIYISG